MRRDKGRLPHRPLQPCTLALIKVQARREAEYEKEVILGERKKIWESGLAGGEWNKAGLTTFCAPQLGILVKSDLNSLLWWKP